MSAVLVGFGVVAAFLTPPPWTVNDFPKLDDTVPGSAIVSVEAFAGPFIEAFAEANTPVEGMAVRTVTEVVIHDTVGDVVQVTDRVTNPDGSTIMTVRTTDEIETVFDVVCPQLNECYTSDASGSGRAWTPDEFLAQELAIPADQVAGRMVERAAARDGVFGMDDDTYWVASTGPDGSSFAVVEFTDEGMDLRMTVQREGVHSQRSTVTSFVEPLEVPQLG